MYKQLVINVNKCHIEFEVGRWHEACAEPFITSNDYLKHRRNFSEVQSSFFGDIISWSDRGMATGTKEECG